MSCSFRSQGFLGRWAELTDLQDVSEIGWLSFATFENTFAFPHTINVGSSDIVLSIGLAPKDEISLIFMLAVPENLLPNWESDLVKVYDMIFEIVGKPELQYEILKMENLEQLQGLLKRKGLII